MKKISIPAQMCDYLESLDYEAESIRELLLFAAERGLEEAPACQKWMRDYTDKRAAFRVAQAELERKFVMPQIENGKAHWSLDYTTRTLTITEADG